MLTSREIAERNEVNYDALMQAGAIHVEGIIRRIIRSRSLGCQEPEGTWSHSLEHGTYWRPSVREDAEGDLVDTSRRRTPQNIWERAFSRRHIVKLVARALRGLEVPADVQYIVDDPSAFSLRYYLKSMINPGRTKFFRPACWAAFPSHAARSSSLPSTNPPRGSLRTRARVRPEPSSSTTRLS